MSQDMERIIAPEHPLRADQYPLDEYNSIGKRGLQRKDGHEKASGYAVYTADVQLPGMLWLRIFTCPFPHARIKTMDTSRAEALPGVRAVLRYDDPELPERADLSGHSKSAQRTQPVLDRVGYWQGMPMGAAVVAETEEIANEALKLVDIDWETRPFNLDQEEALKPGAFLSNPERFPESNFVLPVEQTKARVVYGNPEEGFKEADRIIEWRMRRDRESWVGPERPNGVFRWNGKCPELWLKHQRPYLSKGQVAKFFKVSLSQVTIHCYYQGGSFGGWSQMELNMQPNIIAGILSKRTGRPVKWQFTRREDFCGGGIDNARYHLKVGFKNDGTITAVSGTSWFGKSGFSYLAHFVENSRVRHILQEFNGAVLNIMTGTAIRCEQNPNTFCFAAVLNHVAEALNMDPTEIALKNDGVDGKPMAELADLKRAHGFPPNRDSLKECIEAGKKAIEWDKKWHLPGTRKLPNGKMHGIGFTFTHEWGDWGGAASFGIRIERDDGSARILGQRCDNGCAAETAYCQLAADELGFRYEDVHYRPFEETGFTPMTPDSATNLAINGYAVRNAARKLKQKILEIATTPRIPERPDMGYYPPFENYEPKDLDIKESVVYVKKDPSKRMTMAQLVRPAFFMGKMDIGSTEPLFAWGWQNQQGKFMGTPGPRPLFVRQAHFVEVEVDPETGGVEVTRVVNANDVGKAVNPDAVEGQQYGGSIMGVSRVRTEDMIYCPVTGVVLNGNLIDYKINTMLDCGPIDTLIIETGLGYGPYGSVGIGEDAASVVPFAFYAAVHNAIGSWVDLPTTPDRVLRALDKI